MNQQQCRATLTYDIRRTVANSTPERAVNIGYPPRRTNVQPVLESGVAFLKASIESWSVLYQTVRTQGHPEERAKTQSLRSRERDIVKKVGADLRWYMEPSIKKSMHLRKRVVVVARLGAIPRFYDAK